MNEFLERHGTEVLFFICMTIVLTVISICITIGQMNGNSYYYRTLDNCVSSGGSWIPNSNVGICIMNSSQLAIRD